MAPSYLIRSLILYVQAVACTACIAVVTFFLMLHRLRYPDYSHLWHVSIYTVAIVAAPGELCYCIIWQVHLLRAA